MGAEALLAHLDKVRQTGPSRWTASCPAHQDKNPSLAISEDSDGKVLIYCHAQCGAAAVLNAVGLEFDALFPPKLEPQYLRASMEPRKPRIQWQDVLSIAQDDIFLIGWMAARVGQGQRLGESDMDETLESIQRIMASLSYAVE